MLRRQAMARVLGAALTLPFAAKAQSQSTGSTGSTGQYTLLARFRIDHEYFNDPDGVGGNFQIRPTLQASRFMSISGIFMRQTGDEILILIAANAYDQLRAGYTDYETWEQSDAMKSLVFEIATDDPLFWAYTAPLPGGGSDQSAIWTQSDQLDSSNGDLVVSTAPKSDSNVIGYFELLFAAPGGPLSSLFSSEGPRIEPQDYRLFLAASQIRRRYFIVTSASLEPDDYRIVDSADRQIAYIAKQATLQNGLEAIEMTLAKREPLRARQAIPLALLRRSATGWDRVVPILPGPTPEKLRPPADEAQDSGEPMIAEIFVYI